jgi:hypothetical protein
MGVTASVPSKKIVLLRLGSTTHRDGSRSGLARWIISIPLSMDVLYVSLRTVHTSGLVLYLLHSNTNNKCTYVRTVRKRPTLCAPRALCRLWYLLYRNSHLYYSNFQYPVVNLLFGTGQ